MVDRSNTIAGWVLFGGIIALGAGIVSGKVFHEERPENMGYPIEGVEAEGGEAAAGPSIATLLASADPAKGEGVFKKCIACHTVNQGGANGIGPNLYSVVGEEIGTGKAGFAFSDALKSKGGEWTFEALDEWLTSPRKFAPGTKMTFAGLGNPEDRANVIAYMNAQGSNLPLPVPEAASAEPEAAAAPAENAAAPVEGKTVAAAH
ncbi:c-type cytochrome [Rhizorhapis sp. SPR117]|uniref:c-type cytochrome n=1 Tax=Rhizorhapis sp. SPR117 TaxID=2912611 RepID=UPI001F417667|nr:cytochrome c family protein [Rhizorhapis sp. SPR117]